MSPLRSFPASLAVAASLVVTAANGQEADGPYYDGSWTEWGNSVRMPIETGPGGNV